MSEPEPTPFVTFYSFKGGVGRSMAAINVAGILAARGFRVLVIDMDLEAPGLSFLADTPQDEESRAQQRVGFVDLVLDAVESGTEADLFTLSATDILRRYSAPYELPEEFRRTPGGSLHIMPAGRLDADYSRRLERLDLPGLYREGTGASLMAAFKQAVCDSREFDYVLVDSRTGFSDESGICTRDLADGLIVVSGLNRQNVEGTTRFLATLRRATDADRPLEVVLSPIPMGEDALVDEREAHARKAFGEAWGAEVRTDLHIPYHPQLALTEEPHIFRRRRGYLFDAYNKIERRLLAMFGHTVSVWLPEAQAALSVERTDRVLELLRRIEIVADTRDWANEFALSADFARSESDEVYEFIVDKVAPHVRDRLAERLGEQANQSARWGTVERADTLFRRALRANPTHVDNLCEYGLFLMFEQDDATTAKAIFERAMQATGRQDAEVTGTYALVLWRAGGDMDAAESMFEEALAIDPNNYNNLANYGGFLLSRGDIARGLGLVEAVLSGLSDQARGRSRSIVAECWMYIYCCGSADRRDEALRHLHSMLEHRRPASTDHWYFSGAIEQAVVRNHPEAKWLPVLADVLARRQPVSELHEWPAWRACGEAQAQ